MKILFLGCGDIALRAIRQLKAIGDHQCHGLRRHVDELPASLPATAGDMRDTRLLTTLLDEGRFDAVVVTMTPDSMSDEGYRDSYVAGARSLSEALGRTQSAPQTVIWASSTGVYGQSDGEWVDESSATEPTSFRGRRLLEAEQVIRALPINAAVVRFSGIYGPGRGRLMERVRRGQLAPAHPPQWSNRIHADDAAAVVIHLLSRARRGETLEKVYLASDDEPTPLHEVHRWLAQQLGVRSSEAAAEAGSGAANRRCRNRRLRDSGFEFRYPTFREGYRAILEKSGDGG